MVTARRALPGKDTKAVIRGACTELESALNTAEIRRVLVDPAWDFSDASAPAVTVTLLANTVHALAAAQALPAADSTRALETALRAHRISCTVRMTDRFDPDPALIIALSRAADALAMARLVLAHLTPSQAAAHRLHTALAQADIDAFSIRASDNGITFGEMAAEHALTLGETVLDDSWPLQLNLNDWHHLERLAETLSDVLTTKLGGPIEVRADPRCNHCSRPHEVVLGRMSIEQTDRLASLVERGLSP